MNSKKLPNTALSDVRVFLVDDEDILAWSIETELKAVGAEVRRAASLRQALERFPGFNADVAICDLRLPDGNGLELVQKWRGSHPNMPVILITAHGAVDSAITALRLGAFDYLQKPFEMSDLTAAVKRASEVSTLRSKVSRMQGRESQGMSVDIIGSTDVINTTKNHLRKIAESKANTALVLGESGSGKELAARALHAWSERSSQPFVEINCASIPENLLESELFGFEKGAFTDARDRKIGLFEMAKNGTIFLDEIGEMPFKLQAKLLRALEYRRFKRLGGTKDIDFTARVVAATNRNVLDMVRAKTFRADLYYRLNVLPVVLPSLRERKADIPALSKYLTEKIATELCVEVPSISDKALSKLCEHSWPGNVRELSNVLQRALVFYQPNQIEADHLELDDWSMATSSPSNFNNPLGADAIEAQQIQGASSAGPSTSFALPPEGIKLEEVERSLLEQALDKSRNNQTKAAQLLGISRHTLRYRLEKHSLLPS